METYHDTPNPRIPPVIRIDRPGSATGQWRPAWCLFGIADLARLVSAIPIAPHSRLEIHVAEQFTSPIVPAAHPSPPNLFGANESRLHSRREHLFNSLLSCSLSRGGAQFFTPPPRTAPIVGAHSRRQDPKTPVEQALMRGLGTA
jgi:hypothetical protein